MSKSAVAVESGPSAVFGRAQRRPPPSVHSTGLWASNVFFLLACFLIPVSLLPSSRGTFFRIPPLPYVWWTDNLMLAFGVVAVAFRWLFAPGAAMRASTKRWFLWPILTLAVWQTISLAWDGRDGFMRRYSFLQSMLMSCAVLGGILMASGLRQVERIRLARWMSYLIGGIVAIYAGLSFVFPSWRPSYEGSDLTTKGLGFIRVFGPLGTATTLNFALMPVLGTCVGMLFMPRTWKVFWCGMAFFVLVCVVATGSRGGVLGFAIFCVLLMLALRLRSIVFLAPAAMVLAGLIFAAGVPERFRYLQDPSRADTYRTAIANWSSSARNIVFGAGHGAIYSKEHDDSLRLMEQKTRWYLLEQMTPFGYSLRNSHSAIIRSLAETGIIGVTLQGVPLLWVMGLLLWPRRNGATPTTLFARCVLAGCGAMVAYMFVEEFFISAFWVVLLWTMFAVIGAETIGERYGPSPSPA